MNVNTKILALMAALAAGSALAQSATPVRTGNATNAGTTISNTATASFDDPEKPGTPKDVPSNTVTTEVAAKHGFDITYASGADADATDTVAGAADKKNNVRPGEYVAFEYVAVNNGNAEQTITLSTEVTGVTLSTVKYYEAGATVDPVTGVVTGTELPKVNGAYQIQNLKPSGDDPTTGIVETNSGTQAFVMVYQVPDNIAANTVVGASPVGTALVWNGTANVTATEQKDVGAPTYDDLFWQYSSASTTTPNVTTTPPTVPPTNPLPPYDPNDPKTPGLVVTPPQNPGKPVSPSNPGTGTPNDPVDPGDTPTDPNVPSNPGYKDKTTVVEIGTDRQNAYPQAGVTSVTFTNVVTNVGSLDETVTLIPPTNLPSGVTVSFPGTDADGDPSNGFQVKVPQGGSASYEVKVDFPANEASTTPLIPINVVIGIDSGNDGDTAADDTTTDTIHPPAFLFGDNNGTGFGTTPTPVVTEAVVPGANTATNILTDTTDNVAVFPMNLENTGDYNESYTLSATTTLTGATVRYFDSNGTELPKNTAGQYISPVVGAGKEITVYAVVVVPTATQAGTYKVEQSAFANYSGIEARDKNDVIQVGIIGGVATAKFVKGGTGGSTFGGVTAPTGYGIGAGPSVVPGGTINYVIIGKNTYNTTVNGVVLTDKLSTNVTYGTATCAVYDASDTVVGSKTCTASNVSGTVTTTAVNLASGEYVRLDLGVTIK